MIGILTVCLALSLCTTFIAVLGIAYCLYTSNLTHSEAASNVYQTICLEDDQDVEAFLDPDYD